MENFPKMELNIKQCEREIFGQNAEWPKPNITKKKSICEMCLFVADILFSMFYNEKDKR